MARAPINGDTLRWARTVSRLGRDALAKAAGTKPERIAEFEAGTAAPTFRQLTLMANKLDRPLGFFFVPAPAVPDVPEAADFRGRARDDIPADIAREMKRAEQHREAMLDLTGGSERRWELGPITRDSASERAAQLREQFGLTERFTPPESQQNQVFSFWRGLLEGRGFLVFQTTKIALETFRGLSIHHDSLPIIVLNGADSASGRVFTVLAATLGGLDSRQLYEGPWANRQTSGRCRSHLDPPGAATHESHRGCSARPSCRNIYSRCRREIVQTPNHRVAATCPTLPGRRR
jgi:transcriptional regulator with XRE-family HTH domain